MTYYLFSNILLCFAQVLFLSLNLKAKKNPYITFFAIFIPFTCAALSQYFFSSISPIFIAACTWGLFLLCTIIAFSDSLKKKLSVFVSLVVSAYLMMIITLLVLKIIGADVSIYNNHSEKLTTLLCSFVSISLIILACFLRLGKNQITVSWKQNLPFIIVPISQVGLTIAAWLLFNTELLKSKNDQSQFAAPSFNTVALIIISAIILCIIADLVLFVLMKRVSQNNAMREELRFMEYKNQTSLDYYRTIEKNSFETRKIRHDLNNILQTIYGLSESGAPDGEAVSSIIAEQLKNSIDSIRIEKFSENMLVNAIAANKAEICRENKVEYDFDLRVPQKINIKEIDLCKAFVNIIDNAINAVSQLDESKRKIEISSFVDGDYLYIKSTNPYLSADKKPEKSRSGHGLGQKILADIAESYNGKFITSDDNGVYSALLTMELDNKK